MSSSEGQGIVWRLAYYSLLATIALRALSTQYGLDVSIDALAGSASFPLLFYLGALAWWLGRRRPDRPLQAMRSLPAARMADLLDRSTLFVSSTMFMVWLPPIKMRFPAAAGFWADPYLIGLDRALLGTEAWRLTHAAFGPITSLIDLGYLFWMLLAPLVSLAVAMLAKTERLAQFFLGWALCWTIVGVVLASALPSAGPIFGPALGYGFEDRRQALASAPLTVTGSEFLWAAHMSGETRLGSGISAAPSVHCAVAFLFAFVAWRTRWFVPAAVYAAFIWVGSVHLGWHYLTDGLISLMTLGLLWPAVIRIARMDRAPPMPMARPIAVEAPPPLAS